MTLYFLAEILEMVKIQGIICILFPMSWTSVRRVLPE